MNTSYREMLRDRVPTVVSFALKWCKAKNAWIEHVYENSIGIYAEKKDRHEAARTVLGLGRLNRNFDFHYSITWDNLTDEEKDVWNAVESWVHWFEKYWLTIYDSYTSQTDKCKSDDEILTHIREHNLSNFKEEDAITFSNYLFKCCKEYENLH